jgi:hypothetical protein
MDNKKIGIKHNCPSCYSGGMTVFYELENVPVNSVLNLKTQDQAINFQRGDIALGFCENCGVDSYPTSPMILKHLNIQQNMNRPRAFRRHIVRLQNARPNS